MPYRVSLHDPMSECWQEKSGRAHVGWLGWHQAETTSSWLRVAQQHVHAGVVAGGDLHMALTCMRIRRGASTEWMYRIEQGRRGHVVKVQSVQLVKDTWSSANSACTSAIHIIPPRA